ncbi:hypothetical protein ABZW02_25680 [Streptomyces sp. NPDC005180]|uniref:hypothetical protein n=1 Tax=Streptomyces sp. NPDC005180 TaxID=3156868 RepID=UPI0033B3949E
MEPDVTDLAWIYAVTREQVEHPTPEPGQPDTLSRAERYAWRLRNAATIAASVAQRGDPAEAATARVLGEVLLDDALMDGRITATDPGWPAWSENPLTFIAAEWERATDEERTPYPLRPSAG